MAAPALSPNGAWLFGDAPDNTTAAIYATTIISVREEVATTSPATYRTQVTNVYGVSVAFAGKQTTTIYQAIQNLAIVTS